jgi:endothelin-converting enzyme
MSLAETAKVAPVLGLDYVIGNLSPSNFSNARMITAFPDHIKAISEVLVGTSKETLQTYFMWRVIGQFVNTVLAPEVEPLRQLFNKMAGKVSRLPNSWGLRIR